MKNLILSLLTFIFYPVQAFANPACAVCTVAIGASIGIARRLGIEDSVVGLWAGALLTLFSYWCIKFFDSKNWHFWGRDFLLMLLSVGMIGFIYISEVIYQPHVIWYVFYLDPILFSALLGMLIYIYSQKFYQWMKARNGGHAHFPFEKVVLPLGLLLLASFYLNNFPL